MEGEICFKTSEFTGIYYVSLFAVMFKGRREKRRNRRKNSKEIVRGREKKHRRREWKTGKERWKKTRNIGGTKGGKSRKS
jgi:hypothetical protein